MKTQGRPLVGGSDQPQSRPRAGLNTIVLGPIRARAEPDRSLQLQSNMTDASPMAKVRTSMAFERVSGKAPEFMIVSTKRGMVARKLPTYKRTLSPAQAAAASRLSEAITVWNAMRREQTQEWAVYAKTVTKNDPFTKIEYSPSAVNAFTGLATKFLQVNPGDTIPTTPPEEPYGGDDVMITARAEHGAVVFVASQRNRAGTVTEFLVNRMRNERVTPGLNYRSMGFFAYDDQHLEHEIALEPGWYAVTTKFVCAQTGQASLTGPSMILEVTS